MMDLIFRFAWDETGQSCHGVRPLIGDPRHRADNQYLFPRQRPQRRLQRYGGQIVGQLAKDSARSGCGLSLLAGANPVNRGSC